MHNRLHVGQAVIIVLVIVLQTAYDKVNRPKIRNCHHVQFAADATTLTNVNASCVVFMMQFVLLSMLFD